MGSEWPRSPISDLCELIVDCVNKTAPIVEGPTPFKMIRTTNVRNGRVDTSNCRYVDEDVFLKWTRRARVIEGDVILTREAPMGEVGRISRDESLFLGQRLMEYRANPKALNSRYLLYAFQSQELRHQFFMHEGSGSVVSHIRVPDCSKFVLPLPSLQEQEAIASILGTLEKKIELNRQTNQTLEAMAQALFKSWFVDFDPIIDNALAAGNDIPEPLKVRAAARQAFGDARKSLPEEIRREFPDGFEFRDEMGWMPLGWMPAQFSSIASQVRSSVAVSEIRAEDFYVGLEHIGRKSLFLQDSGLGEDVSSTKSGFSYGDVLFGKLRPYFHKVCLAPAGGICSSDILVFRERSPRLKSYMALSLFSDSLVEYADLRSTGTRMPRAKAQDVLEFPIVRPTDPVLEAFEDLISIAIDKGVVSVFENTTLKNLRDTLLPKLLSGELAIPDAEKLAADAL